MIASTIDVRSEIEPLELIVTSSPGPEFDLMVPDNLERYRRDADGNLAESPDYLLFDDLVLLSAMREEHAVLNAILRAVTGPGGHVTWRQLLVETLGLADARKEAIRRALDVEVRLYSMSDEALNAARASLERLDAPRLAEAFISGRDPLDARPVFRWPMPNALFARDLWAVVRDAIVPTYAAEPARAREMLLSRVILRHHRAFRDVPKLDIGDDGVDVPGLSIEGGDIQVIGEGIVLIGVGVRTTLAAVDALAPLLFERGVETVLALEMPRSRAAMHIDTIFTRIDYDHCLIWPPLVTDPHGVGARVHQIRRGEPRRIVGDDVLAALAASGVALEPVFCGGHDPVAQAREQWSDGANAFALAPGIIICYGRNPMTLRELNRAGYEIVTPERFIDNALFYMGHRRKIVVALRGHELVRGRGGPRCLTLPLRRARRAG